MKKEKKRIKAEDETIEITDWKAADKLIRKIAGLEAEMARKAAQAKRDIDRVKKVLADNVAEPQRLRKQAAKSLEFFAKSHAKDFASQRSKKLNFGTVGWRRSTVVKLAKDTLDLIKRKFPKRDLIRITEGVDKDAVAQLKPAELEKIGAKLITKDKFFVDIQLPKAANY